VGIAEICIVILVLMIGLPILFRLLKALGPLFAVIIGLALAVGLVVLAVNLIGSLISGAFNLLFGPLGLLLAGGAVTLLLYRRWQSRQLNPGGVVTLDDKRKRTGSSTRLEIGDDGEIVTLDELMDEDGEKKKRG
jgi:hypothetical protein